MCGLAELKKGGSLPPPVQPQAPPHKLGQMTPEMVMQMQAQMQMMMMPMQMHNCTWP